MQIENIPLDSQVLLAPMAGVADRAMRELCRAYGAGAVFGELTSSKGVCMNDRKSRVLLAVWPEERPMASQLFGCEPEIMARAAQAAMQYHPDFLDINMGCPAPKVALHGGGSSLMKNPELAASIVEAVVHVSEVPVTVKMRTGWDAENINAPQLAKLCEQAGASMITVHGRTKAQRYAPPIDYDTIAEVKRAVSVPVIGNGDIFTPQDAAKMLEKTNCDGIMIGRGAQGRPWIFSAVNAYLTQGILLPEPPVPERMRVLLCHAQLAEKYREPHLAFLQMRKHAAWYIKGIRGAAHFRDACGHISSMDDLKRLAFSVCESAERFSTNENETGE